MRKLRKIVKILQRLTCDHVPYPYVPLGHDDGSKVCSLCGANYVPKVTSKPN